MDDLLSTVEMIKLHESFEIKPLVWDEDMVLTPREDAASFLAQVIDSGLIVPDYEAFSVVSDIYIRVEEMGFTGEYGAVDIGVWKNVIEKSSDSVTHYEFSVFRKFR
ncbi:hypothetical protein [Microbulbifer sp. MCCC 1A16149]|uniref:hypothetical protein n=1 Tax=Microbulbifer sp. MCCC 1A16149 TaxID=3411322 RepID=UPI003D14B1A1